MSDEQKEPENIINFQKLSDSHQSPKKLGDLLKEDGITFSKTSAPKLSFDNVTSFTVLLPVGNFLHNLDYVKDPLFYDSVNSTAEIDETSEAYVTSFEEVTLKIKILKNKTGEIVGIVVDDSDLSSV